MYPLKSLTALLLSFIGTAAMAHPGHGSENVDPSSAFHYLLSLGHLVPLLTVVGIILFAIMKKRTESRRALRK